MTTLAVRAPPVPVPVRLDHVLLRRAFLVMGVALAMFAPFTPDPIKFAVGGFVPWLVLRIVGTATLPAAVVYYLLWQWLQVYARTLVSVTDGEDMARGLFGPGSSTPTGTCWPARHPGPRHPGRLGTRTAADAAPGDGPSRLAAGRSLPVLSRLAAGLDRRTLPLHAIPALDQPMEPVARIKFIALLMLFGGVLSAGRGVGFLLAAVMAELVIGLPAGDFRSVFIVLFVSALAVRIRWTAMTSIVVAAAAILLVTLGLFWTR